MPGLFQKIFNRLTKVATPGLGIADIGNDPFTLWSSTKRVTASKAMSIYHGWVYACTRAIAEEIANMQWRLFKVGKDGDDEELFEHEILDLLDGVNEFQTGYELKYTMGAHLELAGNVYLYLDGVNAEGGKPKAFYILKPSGVRIVVDRSQFPHRISKYVYTETGKQYEFEPYQILHLKYPDPNDSEEGIGTVQSIASWIDADNYAMEFNRRFFQNGARIGGVLESENARTSAQLDYIKKSFEAIHKGYDSAYKTLVLPKGTKYTQASESQKDMDFANLMVMMRDRVLAGFRVPRTVLGITDDVNRSNAEATNYVFALRTIKPKMELIVSYLNEFLVPRYGDDLYLSFEDPVPENTELKIQEMQASGGILSPNEKRERYFSYKPIQNGDDVMIPFSEVPLGSPSEQPTKSRKPTARSKGKPSVKYARAAKMRKELSKEFSERVMENLRQMGERQKSIAEKKITDLTTEEYEIVYRAFALRVNNYIKLLVTAVRKVNKGQHQRVLQNLPAAIKSVKSTKGVDASTLMNLEDEVAITIDFASPILTDLYDKESRAAAEALGITAFDILANPAVKRALDHAISLMAESYTATTLELLKSKLDEGISQGASISELTNLVSQIYEYSDDARAEMVARTEAFRIANDSTKQTWKESGIVKSMRWYTAEDERVCPLCGPLDGKVVSIDQNFFDKGDTVQGSDGSTLEVSYDHVGAPPLHPDCRCYVRPEELSTE